VGLSDEELGVHVTWVLAQGLFLTSVISVLDVLPVVELEFALAGSASPLTISVATAALTAALLPIELLLLFLVALYCAHSVGSFVQLGEEQMLGAFNTDRQEKALLVVTPPVFFYLLFRLLARAALELDDPEGLSAPFCSRILNPDTSSFSSSSSFQ